MTTKQTAQSVFTVIITGATGTIIMDNDDIKDVYFIEDIYSYLMTGRMICRDTRGLSEFLPIIGNELITIEYGTNVDGPTGFYEIKSLTFQIIKMGWIENTNDKHRHIFEIFFIQEPHRKLHMEHYSYSYKCMKYTEMIEDLLSRHAGIEDFNEFEHGIEELQYFYTGLKTPAQNVEWLGSRTASEVSGEPGYLLFANTQNPDVPYNFVSLETLLARKTLLVPEAGDYTIGAHHEYNINRFLNYKDSRVDKRGLERIMNFINLGYDIRRKRYLKNEYTYREALDKFTCLGRMSLFSEAVDELVSTDQELTAEVEEEEIMKNIYFGDWVKRYCLQHTVSALIEGHVNRYAGGMIKVAWPSADDDEIIDKTMAGMFLVKSITHSFVPLQKPVYMQKLILIKNGYDRSDGNLTPASKMNLGPTEIEISPFYNVGIRGL